MSCAGVKARKLERYKNKDGDLLLFVGVDCGIEMEEQQIMIEVYWGIRVLTVAHSACKNRKIQLSEDTTQLSLVKGER